MAFQNHFERIICGGSALAAGLRAQGFAEKQRNPICPEQTRSFHRSGALYLQGLFQCKKTNQIL